MESLDVACLGVVLVFFGLSLGLIRVFELLR